MSFVYFVWYSVSTPWSIKNVPLFFTPSPTKCRWRHHVFIVFVRLFVRASVRLACMDFERKYLQND